MIYSNGDSFQTPSTLYHADLEYQIRGRNSPRLQWITVDVISKHDDAAGYCTAHNQEQADLVHKQCPAIKSKLSYSDPALLLAFIFFCNYLVSWCGKNTTSTCDYKKYNFMPFGVELMHLFDVICEKLDAFNVH